MIDDEESLAQRRRRKEEGRDIVDTAQGFQLTEDQFYCREEWPLPGRFSLVVKRFSLVVQRFSLVV